jgi:outer membrane receptor protein involved in Fe transport
MKQKGTAWRGLPGAAALHGSLRASVSFTAIPLLLCAAFVPTAEAQSQSGTDGGQDELAEVRVTGSRVSQSTTAPTPLTVMSATELQAAAPGSISDALNQIPQFRNSDTPASNGVTTGSNSGASFLNLRSLGSNRTLVLLDGRRVAPSTTAGVTDISVLPEALVKRVEVVTGGASAVYGSDAVAGVVNFILDDRFTGFKSAVQGGLSDRGDAGNVKVQLTGGASLFGDRGHVLLSGSYYKHNGLRQYADRDWFDSCARIANPAGTPATVSACNVHSSAFTYGGMIPSGPLKGTQFRPDGTAAPFVYGDLATASSMVGGSGSGDVNGDVGAYFQPVTALDRRNLFARFTYDITDDVKVYVQGLYGKAVSQYVGTWPWQGGASGYTIQVDNAYLPESVRTSMQNLGITSFPLNRYDYDFGPLLNTNTNKTTEGVIGLEGRVGDWTWRAHYEHGENRLQLVTLNNPIVNNEYNAADAVVNPATGQIVCRSTLTQPDNGCVPINLFGSGSASREALDYILGTTWQNLLVKQDVAEASVAGAPFNTWAGAVTTALGAGYRRMSSDQTVDPISSSYKHFTGGYLGFPASLEGQLGGFDRSNPAPVAGSYHLSELFAEAEVPLASDLAWAKSLDLNAAVRYTDYSTSGGVVSWKGGLTYSPNSQWRLRAARSRDIRAPNVGELYSSPRQGQSNLIDPFQPVGSPYRSVPVYIVQSGSTDLDPESADTTTVGVVYQPAWLNGFSASIDYYDIKLKDAIGTLDGQVTVNQCYAGAADLCSLLKRDANGALLSVSTPYLNISERATRGVDFESAYHAPLGSIVPDAPGDFELRLLANFVSSLTTSNPGAPTLQLAGQTGGGGGVPKWAATFSAAYNLGPFGLRAQERYIGPGKIDNSLSSAILSASDNQVSEVFYTDLNLDYRFGESQEWEAFLTVNNLMDRDPPMAPSNYFVFGTSWGGTNPAIFDVIGRTYTLGFRILL